MSDKPDDADKKPDNTLTDDQIVSEPALERRSLLQLIGTAVGAALGAVVLAPSEAEAQVTDRDAGRFADPPGRGRGRYRPARPVYRRRTGYTDRDPSDGVGYGVCALRGHTDSDGGRNSDP